MSALPSFRFNQTAWKNICNIQPKTTISQYHHAFSNRPCVLDRPLVAASPTTVSAITSNFHFKTYLILTFELTFLNFHFINFFLLAVNQSIKMSWKERVSGAIASLKARGGSSLPAIKKALGGKFFCVCFKYFSYFLMPPFKLTFQTSFFFFLNHS